MSAADSFALIDEADPALIYLVFTWLRKRYADHTNADAVIGRLLAISDRYTAVTKKMNEGKSDPVVAWFEESYSYKDLPKAEFIELDWDPAMLRYYEGAADRMAEMARDLPPADGKR